MTAETILTNNTIDIFAHTAGASHVNAAPPQGEQQVCP